MTYTFEQLKEDVKKEAEALRVHATEEELEKLDFTIVDPTHKQLCYYGQMTGNCFSRRAAELIDKCCSRYFAPELMPNGGHVNMKRVSKYANGTKVKDFVNERSSMIEETHFSAIEAYILLPKAKNKNLIAYLRSETETLEL